MQTDIRHGQRMALYASIQRITAIGAQAPAPPAYASPPPTRHGSARPFPAGRDGNSGTPTARFPYHTRRRVRREKRCSRDVKIPERQTFPHNPGTRGTARRTSDPARVPASSGCHIQPPVRDAPLQPTTSRVARNRNGRFRSCTAQTGERAAQALEPDAFVSSHIPGCCFISEQKNCSV